MNHVRVVHLLVSAALALTPGLASTYTTNFSGFSSGSINGQNGWSVTGPFDQSITTFSGSNVFQMSNETASTTFADMPYSAALPALAGEGTPYNFFSTTFTFHSATGAGQNGLDLQVGPYNAGETGRQNLFEITDTGSGGLDVGFWDTDGSGNFNEHSIGSGLSYTDWHTATMNIVFNPGPGNDVVTVWLDGNLIGTFNSFDSYYPLFEPGTDSTVDSVLFRARNAGTGLTGNGLYFGSLSLTETSVPEPASATMLAAGLFGLLLVPRRRPPASRES